jgi:hypothetical protein
VGDHDARPAGDQRLDQRRGARIQPRVRLVQQQDLGGVQHRARDRRPLQHPAREGVHRVRGAGAHPHRLQQLVDAREGHAVQARVELEVLARGEVAVQQRVVAEEADLPAHRPTLARQRVPEDLGGPVVRAQQRAQDAQERRLARAVGTEHRECLSLLDRERHAGERDALPVGAAEVSQLDRSHGATSPRAGCAPRA